MGLLDQKQSVSATTIELQDKNSIVLERGRPVSSRLR